MRKLKIQGASIYKDSNGTTAMWRVRLGKRFTGGEPVKKSFDSYVAASKWLREQVEAKDVHGQGAFLLSDSQLAEAQDSLQRLSKAGQKVGRQFSLSGAVTYFLRHGAPRGGRKNVSEVVALWIAEKKAGEKKATPTLQGVASVLNRFADRFATKPINEISVADAQKFIDALDVSANSKIHYSKDLSTLFAWAAKPGRQWTEENPWLHVTLPKKQPIEIGILSPLQAARLLAAAARQPGAPLLSSLVLGLFAGLRTAERARLDWEALRLDAERPFVEIRAKWAKTSARRTVALCPAALKWLRLLPQKRVGVINPPNAEARFAELCKEAGVDCPRNGLRHSFASYRYAILRDAATVAADLGHDNLRTLKRH